MALLSDVHIAADKATKTGDAVMWETMGQAVREILALDPLPGNAIVNGDCAHFYGKPEDYRTFAEGIEPLRRAGIAVHLTLGNHDHRENFLKALGPGDARVNDKAVQDRVVGIVPLARANLFLMDSLEATDKVTGLMGPAQLEWLGKALDARADKPAIVFVHHNPDLRAPEKVTGLKESKELYDVLRPRKHARALVFGHTHVWNCGRRGDLHLINLPPTAWLFVGALPRGWVDLRLGDKGAAFELRALDKEHPMHADRADVPWTAG